MPELFYETLFYLIHSQGAAFVLKSYKVIKNPFSSPVFNGNCYLRSSQIRHAMKRLSLMFLFWILLLPAASHAQNTNPDTFPDGKPVPAWFAEDGKVDMSALGPQYVVTRYGVKRDSTRVQTEAIQQVIDLAAKNGGGVIVIPKGTFLSGNLFFKPGTHLLIRKGGALDGNGLHYWEEFWIRREWNRQCTNKDAQRSGGPLTF